MNARAPLPVALSCGDPSGIGPELAEAAWRRLGAKVPFVWIGDCRHLPGNVRHVEVSDPAEAIVAAATGLPVLHHGFATEARPGTPAPENARGVIDVLERAVELVMNRSASALCTAPINKKQLVDHADFKHPGHTEFLAALSGTPRAVMMLAAEELKIIPATIHIPLKDVAKTLDAATLNETIEIAYGAMRKHFGLSAPRIAVSGLNPHAGEGGMLGLEDDAIIRPVCDALRARGWDVIGPLPGDTMFHAAARATYDIAIAMYHDQALIPIKTLAFDRGVNVTLGLPFVRTSPDHGTAYDIAGKGIASPTSLIEALKLAQSMAAA